MIDRKYEGDLGEVTLLLASTQDSIKGLSALDDKTKSKITNIEGIDVVFICQLETALEKVSKLMSIECEESVFDDIKRFLRRAYKNIMHARIGLEFNNICNIKTNSIDEALMDIDYAAAIVGKYLEKHNRGFAHGVQI